MEPKTRGILYKILGVAVGFVVGYVVVYSLFDAFSGGDDKVLKGLQTVSQEVNKSCPMQVDAYTVLKATSVLPPRTLRYHYTLTLPEGFDLETSKEGFISVVKNQVRPNPTWRSCAILERSFPTPTTLRTARIFSISK